VRFLTDDPELWCAKIIGFQGEEFFSEGEEKHEVEIEVKQAESSEIVVDWYYLPEDIKHQDTLRKEVAPGNRPRMLCDAMEEDVSLLGRDSENISFGFVDGEFR
jgi:phosphatidylserine/phosphatidylglycerophosphate/cardiolipin synthase-like enzyme